jgi:hypothetical protein
VFHGNIDILLDNDEFMIKKVDPAYKGFLRRAYNHDDLKYPYSKESYYQESIELDGDKYGVLKDEKSHGNFKCKRDLFDVIEFSEYTKSYDPIEKAFKPFSYYFVDNAYMINLGGKKFNEEHYLKHRFIARNRNFPHTFDWRQSKTFKNRCIDDAKERRNS